MNAGTLKSFLNRTMSVHDVTIFPIYDTEHNVGNSPSHLGCLNSNAPLCVELPGGTFIDAIRKAQAKGITKLGPGHYLMLEWSDDIEEHKGLIFTVHTDGRISPQCLADQHVSLATWPPRKLSV